jgi:hypothetical protein
VEEQKEMRDKCRNVVQRMMNASMVQCFELWVDFVDDQREHKVRPRCRPFPFPLQAASLWRCDGLDA